MDFRSLLYALVVILVCTCCKGKRKHLEYSSYTVAGSAKVSICRDSVFLDEGIVNNSIYIEYATDDHIYVSKPVNREINFPDLQDSLKSISFYYYNFKFVVDSTMINQFKKFLYFPNRDSVIFYVSDTPFEEGKSHRGAYYYQNNKFVKLQLDSVNATYFTLSRDLAQPEMTIQ